MHHMPELEQVRNGDFLASRRRTVVALSGFRWKDENLRTRGTMTDLRATHGSRKLSECVFSKITHKAQNIEQKIYEDSAMAYKQVR